jgi:methylase of polypeptide subunit release factors
VLEVIAEPRSDSQQREASVSLKVIPDKNEAQDERAFALTLIKYPTEPVLDVGTGFCACVACTLASQGTRVIALDEDPAAIRAARRLLKKRHINEAVMLLREDITESSLASSSFQNIVCSRSYLALLTSLLQPRRI